MKKADLLAKNLVAYEHTSIGEALMMITDNQRGAVVVVDEDFVYRGVVSDGEIRRGLVHGATSLAPLSKIVNMNARALLERDTAQADDLFAEYQSITMIPILAKGNVLANVVVRGSDQRKKV